MRCPRVPWHTMRLSVLASLFHYAEQPRKHHVGYEIARSSQMLSLHHLNGQGCSLPTCTLMRPAVSCWLANSSSAFITEPRCSVSTGQAAITTEYESTQKEPSFMTALSKDVQLLYARLIAPWDVQAGLRYYRPRANASSRGSAVIGIHGSRLTASKSWQPVEVRPVRSVGPRCIGVRSALDEQAHF